MYTKPKRLRRSQLAVPGSDENKMAKAIAAMSGRDFVTPDDIKFVAVPVLNHRVILTPDREMEGVTSDDVIREIIQKVEVPR